MIKERRRSPPYRTVLFLMYLGGLMLAALGLVLAKGQSDMGQKMLSDVIYGLVFLGVAQAGKSSVQDLAGGGGVRGAVAALMTSAKPGDPAQSSPQVTTTTVVTPQS